MDYQGFSLDPFQAKAIEALQAGESVLVAAPTGTGKTVVADWLVERMLGIGKDVVYTAPIKALSNQKFRDYRALFGEDRVGLVTGDLVIRREAPCRVMTTEILRNILLSGEGLPRLGAVIVDEIHYLDDRERGTTWEEVLLYLPATVQVLGLSATLSNLDEFAAWLGEVRGRPLVVIEEQKRAVPLHFYVATRETGLREPREMHQAWQRWARKNAPLLRQAERLRHRGRWGHAPEIGRPTRHLDVIRLLVPDLLPVLYFVYSRKQAEAWARQLAWRLPAEGLLPGSARTEVEARLDAFEATAGPDILDRSLGDLYRKGVAFHHAGLHVQLKALVEELYEARLVGVLYTTGTFAVGINMPARTAAFEGLERYDGREMIRLPTREFMQMAGRAGRRGKDAEGFVVVRSDFATYDHVHPLLEHHLRGRYEPVKSSFSLSFNSVVNLLHRNPPERVRTLVERSFLAFHRARAARDARQEAEVLRGQLQARGWAPERGTPAALKREVKELKRLESSAAGGEGQTWAEFQEKVAFLQSIGYLAPDGSFNAGARVLLSIQIQEIFATELFLQGIFDALPIPVLFGVLCGLCQNLPRGARVWAGREYRGLARQIEQVRHSDVVLEAERLTHAEVVWDGQMIVFGRWWAEGRSLSEILLNVQSPTDISGDLVGAFRRARELAGQLKAVWESFDPDRAREVGALVRTVSRGEVEVVD